MCKKEDKMMDCKCKCTKEKEKPCFENKYINECCKPFMKY